MGNWLVALAEYPYLVCSMGLLITALIAIYFVPERRWDLLIAGLYATPMALNSIAMVPEYWNPRRIAVLLIGPEDLLFSFSFGVIAWSLAVFPWRSRLALRQRSLPALIWAAILALSGFLLYSAVRITGAMTMNSHLAAMAALTLALLALRRHLWRLSVTGALSLPLFYTLASMPVVFVWPEFFSQWSEGGTSGYSFVGIPIEELLWCMAYGACFPAMLGSMFDARIAPKQEKQAIISRVPQEL